MIDTSKLHVGDWIEVRSKEEILATLDEQGTLEGMPFMPEMLEFCGRRFPIVRRAHKTCDTVFPIRSRRVKHAVHLATRCSGQAHGGCQAGCLIFWKEAWLNPVGGNVAGGPPPSAPAGTQPGASEEDVYRATQSESGDASEPVYVCQATRLPYATEDLSPYDVRQYIEDYTSGNVGAGQFIRGLIYMVYENLINAGIGVGPVLRWVYERLQTLLGGLPYPRRPGRIPMGKSTPTAALNLQPGEFVRVKSYEEILATCREDNRNRGLGFDGEMVPYCGKTYHVLRRVDTIINERSGKMDRMKNPCIVLDGVVCEGRYSACRMFCPRQIFPYWREIWLERVAPAGAESQGAQARPTDAA